MSVELVTPRQIVFRALVTEMRGNRAYLVWENARGSLVLNVDRFAACDYMPRIGDAITLTLDLTISPDRGVIQNVAVVGVRDVCQDLRAQLMRPHGHLDTPGESLQSWSDQNPWAEAL